jgi:hypothetical protein
MTREHESPCARKCEDVATHTKINSDGSEELLCCNHFEDEINLPILELLAATTDISATK